MREGTSQEADPRATDVLPATVDRFGGVTPDTARLRDNAEEFVRRMARSLEVWRAQGRRLVWLRLPSHRAELVPQAVALGFRYHHVDGDTLVLTLGLAEDVYVPHYATHYVGIGGVVLDGSGRLLVVSERFRRDRARPYYKLPGGALHPGEHLADAAVREVLEETGVRTRFEALVCVRHWHGYRFGRSDLYFVCRLTPLSTAITRQEEEIEECLWMPVEEYMASEYVSPFNKMVVQAALKSRGWSSVPVVGYPHPDRFEFFMPPEVSEEG